MAYAGGATDCAGLAIGGQTDWRLPTRIEALTLLGQPLGLLNQAVFPDGALPSSPVVLWTDSLSLLAAKLDDRFQLKLKLGLVTVAANTAISNRIKCVRGGAHDLAFHALRRGLRRRAGRADGRRLPRGRSHPQPHVRGRLRNGEHRGRGVRVGRALRALRAVVVGRRPWP